MKVKGRLIWTVVVLAVLCLALWAPKEWLDAVVRQMHHSPEETALATGRSVVRVTAVVAVVIAVWSVKALWVDVVVGFLAVSLLLAAVSVVSEAGHTLGAEPEGVAVPHEGSAWFDLPKDKVEAPQQQLPALAPVNATLVIPIRNEDGKLLRFETHVYPALVRSGVEASGATEDVGISIRRGKADAQVRCLTADLVSVRTIRLDARQSDYKPPMRVCQ